jgi:hypothetical protein
MVIINFFLRSKIFTAGFRPRNRRLQPLPSLVIDLLKLASGMKMPMNTGIRASIAYGGVPNPRPCAIFFVIARSLIHDARPVLIPNCIFMTAIKVGLPWRTAL